MKKDTEELELSADELAEFFADEETVSFVVERTLASGKVVSKTFILTVDPNKIGQKDMAVYRRKVAESAVKTDEIRLQAQGLNTGEEIVDAETLSEEALQRTTQNNIREVNLRVDLMDTNDDYARASAELLAKLVLKCDYPDKDFSDPAVLSQRVGAGPAALEALNDYFFGSSDEPEVETGTPPTPSTENASDSPEQTVSEDATPADFLIFELAAKFSTDPCTVMSWPAWMVDRARFWLSAKNQAENDRAENEAAAREAGIIP